MDIIGLRFQPACAHKSAGQKTTLGTEIELKGGVRFGSHDSIDKDTVYAVEHLPNTQQCKALCIDRTENRNLVVIREGVVADCYKGLPDETNNALYHTYTLHEQQSPNLVTQPVVRVAPLKVVRASRVVLSLLANTDYRPEIKEALSSMNLAHRLDVLGRVDFTKLNLSPDVLKSIAFQMAQTNALIEGQELYTKQSIQAYTPEVADFISRRPGQLKVLNDIRDSLLERVDGVYVRQKGDLNLLMYGNSLAIRDWNLYARQCRGMVIDMKRERCVSFPMDKFFRFGEGPEVSRESLSPELAVEIVEKVDGSMVSLIHHNKQYQFCCKGNFDTPQTERAAQIAARLPIDQLQTDRYFHVFEVLYPENRFPQGLSIVDYGAREDLVLTSMRDRLTNQMVPYSDVVKEAQRVGLSHPKVFRGGLLEVFREVDTAAPSLHEEGFIIRTQADGKLFKLKYSGYKEVLRMVNEMRTDRFVKEHISLEPRRRVEGLELLPADIRIVAEGQLNIHKAIMQNICDYAEQIVAQGPKKDQRAFAAFVKEQVPEDFQNLVFRCFRKGVTLEDSVLEKLAIAVYYKEVQIPEFVSTDV